MANAEVAKVIQGLKAQGAIVESRGKNMQRVRSGLTGAYVDIHSTPSDNRWRDNLKPKVEKAGWVWPLDDSRKLKMAVKQYRNPTFGPSIPDSGDEFSVPEGPLEHVRVPPGVRALEGRRPLDRSVGLVRGAVFNLGPDKRTFWTAEVADQLNDFVGFRSSYTKQRGSGGVAVQRCQGILDWLGYRVVEARPNRNGFIYRWALDPTRDRSKRETLPLIVPTPENSDVPQEEIEESILVEPPKSLLPEEPQPVEVKKEAPVETATTPAAGLEDSGELQEAVPVPARDAIPEEPQPTEPPAPVEEAAVASIGEISETRPRTPDGVSAQPSTGNDVAAALALLDESGSWAVSLAALGKEGKRLEKMISRLGLAGELRVWRR